MKFISYYTKNTPYKQIMEELLLPTLKKYNLDYYIEEVPDLGDWYSNTEYKATFIKNCLLKFKEDIVFNDADSQIIQYPQLFFDIPKEYDFAAHYMDWYLQWRRERGKGQFELLSGTMMFRYNKKVLSLCDEYINECGKIKGKFEQKVLQDVIDSQNNIKVYNLPAGYCTVVLHNNQVPDYISNPVIIHSQASRKFKNRPRR